MQGLNGGRSTVVAFLGGALIGVVGGLIGLGGAEFRLPLLIGLFGFAALPAVILNKTISLVVVVSALLFRMRVVSADEIADQWPTILNLLAGSLTGAWLGAGWATRMSGELLRRVLAGLLVLIAAILLVSHDPSSGQPLLTGMSQIVTGVVAGLAIGLVASLMGVAGGELLIPTLVLLFGLNIKLAGSVSLAVSLPTMLAGFARYSLDQSFSVVTQNRKLIIAMAAGSIVGTLFGGLLLQVVAAAVLLPLLAAILVLSAIKVWRPWLLRF